MLSVFIDLAFAEQNDVVIIEKPKLCNSANLNYYYTLENSRKNTNIHVLHICKNL